MSLLQYFTRIPSEQDSKDLTEKIEYEDHQFSVSFFPCILTYQDIDDWLVKLSLLFHDKKRRTILVGNEGIIYSVTYQGITNQRKCKPWTTIEGLTELKDKIEELTNEKYTVCAIMHYSSGKIGIAPHRDKEMIEGTKIAGLSLGQQRTISFSNSSKEIDIKLASGSLYVMNPPTNQNWLHCIKKDNSKNSRYVLTFRSYK